MDGDARSRRASTGSEAGPRRIDPKPSILLACRVLRAVGVGSLTAELLRRAKFDKPEAAWPLWQLVQELAQYLAEFCGRRRRRDDRGANAG